MSIDVGSAKDLQKGASIHDTANEDDAMAGARIGNAPTQAIHVNSVNQEGAMAGAYLSDLSGNRSTQALSTYSCPSLFSLHHGHGTSHQNEGWCGRAIFLLGVRVPRVHCSIGGSKRGQRK
jgi:hypothetical protein